MADSARALERDEVSLIRFRIPESERLCFNMLAEGGQHGWANLIRWIFVSEWLRQSIRVVCPATGLRRNLGWASTRPFSGFGASERPAELRMARWVSTSRRRFRESTVIGCWSAPRHGTSPYAGWWPNSTSSG